jgi:SAM-dependent methyltransferase
MSEEPEALHGSRIFTPEYYQRMRELESSSWWNAGMREVATELLSLAALPGSGMMLDVGCGSGQTMSWFTQTHPGWRSFGLDVAPEGLAAATALGESVLRASALDLPARSASVDLIITLDVLQHLPLDGGDRRAIAEFVRVLKPGGHLLIRTNGQSFPPAADDPVYDFHKYETDELREKLTAAGLNVIRVGRLNALLGLAEIPRELKADKGQHSYHGILAQPRVEPAWRSGLKRAWLRMEGRLVRAGGSWPLGRTILAICQR